MPYFAQKVAHFKSDLITYVFRDTCSLRAALSIEATLCVGLEQDYLKAAILSWKTDVMPTAHGF